MSIRYGLIFSGLFLGDGSSTTFSFDLKDFPNTNGEYIDFRITPDPTAVVSQGGDLPYTVSNSGRVVTLTFATAPNSTEHSFSLFLVF